MEAKNEMKTHRTQLLPLQFSALSTFLAGAVAGKPTDTEKRDRDDVKYSRQVAMGVGLSWLTFSYFFNEEYMPYSKAQSIVKAMPEQNSQDQLVRERIAEEHIAAAASLGRKLMWASTVTNLAACAYLANNTNNEGAVYAATAGLLSLAPLVFRDRWQIVDEYHQDYKKRIYGPITMPTLMASPIAAHTSKVEMVPGVLWSFNF